MIKGLYIHIPFCRSICAYCDFLKMVSSEENQNHYIDALIKEIDFYKDNFKDLETIFIGGGTPSMLTDVNLKKLFSCLQQYIDFSKLIEVTIETNPEDISLSKAQLFKSFGVNRVSIGVETFDENLQVFINRKNSFLTVKEAILNLRSVGISNINVDMMYAIPFQTLSIIWDDLSKLEALNIEHVSYYALILEEKTVLDYKRKRNELDLINEEIEIKMQEAIEDSLQKQGFTKYEISNFAKPGYKSRHNLLYWNLEEYIGVGAGSHSQYGNNRVYNPESVKEYLNMIDLHAIQSKPEQYPFMALEETFLMGLRKTDGVNLEKVLSDFNTDIFTKYPMLSSYVELGLLEIVDNHLRFTKKGELLGNLVFQVFV